MVEEKTVLEALREVIDPELGISIVDLGMVRRVQVEKGAVNVLIALTVPGCPLARTIESDVRTALMQLKGVESAQVELTSMTTEELEALRGRLKARGRERGVPHGIEKLGKGGIRIIVAVGSGKGGVGKSFVTGYLASELRRMGYKVGVLDADVTGPSMAKIFGVTNRPLLKGDAILPVTTRTGIEIMSMNLILDDPDAPVIWRGPIINSVVRQLYAQVEWGDLHFLLVDLPPGTSDAPLTVFQSLPLDGLLVVSTPQELAVMIVKKAVNMAKTMNVPILGVIENMGYLDCPSCGARVEPFGPSKVAGAAGEAGIPFLGSLPLDPRVSPLTDEGRVEDYGNERFSEVARSLRIAVTRLLKKTGATPIAWPGGG